MKKIYWETKHSEGHFLPWVPLCEQHPDEQLSQPLSPSASNLTRRQFCDDLKFIFVVSRHNCEERWVTNIISQLIFSPKRFLNVLFLSVLLTISFRPFLNNVEMACNVVHVVLKKVAVVVRQTSKGEGKDWKKKNDKSVVKKNLSGGRG